MEYILNAGNSEIVLKIIEAIHQNAEYLSEIDGATGDGDHGVNMNKGFLMAKERIMNKELSFAEAIKILGRTLIMDIGGSMGPIYGTMFNEFWKALKTTEKIQATDLLNALNNSTTALMDLAGAKVGDKTLIDTIVPARDAFANALQEGKSFFESLEELSAGAEAGKENTKNMMAKIGRAARLQERSIGFLDAGATSCCIILQTMASAMKGHIQNEEI
ncbi:dihydroxyacetone kinase subunit DhaL [Irregularibacter muris]|uniref:phosphoenolpyruvate--glycerone phosphotransferase n=1 Tax=Irregularibacter muris TaxID=1796619 RepID=A0AAE3HHV6_9FIRM|nr:dihydroxyacetone kinase subunit DhaL [Irregularibacter muris]MCR1899413.1 dihydroxyacetone kinase subunit DhaL [Irregularibacter muris]